MRTFSLLDEVEDCPLRMKQLHMKSLNPLIKVFIDR
uniref:Uncharacterized protein n=1 Tax=Rhizophora mucronata TaxID=61149 RepID=A0A2P2QZA1_RHIMU